MKRSAPPKKRSPTRKAAAPSHPRAKAPVSRRNIVRPPAPSGPDEVRPLALEAISAALDKKAERPTLLDVRQLSSYADYVLLLSGDSERQLDAIVRAIEDRLRAKGKRARGVEDAGDTGWILLDFGDLVIHVFLPETRGFYDLEGLWADAPRVTLPKSEPGPAGS